MTPQEVRDQLDTADYSDDEILNTKQVKPLVEKYAYYRARGYSEVKSFRIAFGFGNGDRLNDHEKFERLEVTKTYLDIQRKAIEELTFDIKFEEKRIASKLLEAIESRTITDAAKMKAIEQYIVMAGLGELDDNGKMRLKVDPMADALQRIAASMEKGKSIDESDLIKAVLFKLGIDADSFNLVEFMAADNPVQH